MSSLSNVVFLRYWGSHFKSLRQAGVFAGELRPLVKRGWSCYLVLQRPPEDRAWLDELLGMGVKILYAPRPRHNFDLSCILRIRRLVRQVRATIFHCDNMHTSPLIGAALGGAPVRFWFKRAMNPESEEQRPPTLKERISISLRISCWLCTRVTALSQAVKGELVVLGVPEQKILVRNNPLRLGQRTAAVDRESVRSGWGCSPENVIIITLGWAKPYKGWDTLVRAFAGVAKKDPNARLVLVGSYTSSDEQPFYNKLMEFIRGQQLSDKVVFTGHTGDITSVLKAADLFVLASRNEGCASAPVEALEAGLPCVLTRVGHAAEIIQPGVNGFLVDRFDVEGLTTAILEITQNEALRAEMTRNAKVPPHIVDMEQYAEQLAVDYENALRERQKPEYGIQSLERVRK